MGCDRWNGRWVWWLLSCLVAGPAAAEAPASLAAAVAIVRQMPQPSQQAFAQLALDHLIERFRTELRHTPGKAAGWQRGTGGYLGQLESLRAALDGEAPVRFLGGPRGAFRLLVGSRQVMLQTPREAVQGAFERALVDDWCAMTECGNPLAAAPVARLATGAPPTVAPIRTEPALAAAPVAPEHTVPKPIEVPSVPGSGASEARASALPAVPQATPRPVEPPVRTARLVESAAPGGPAPAVESGVVTALPGPKAEVAATEVVPTVAPATTGSRLPATERPAERLTVPATRAVVPVPRPGTWQFSDDAGPTYASEDGLQCVYADSRHLKLKQASCTAVMQDLRRVVAALRAQASRGGAIDWDALRLEPRGLGNPAHLRVGGAGTGFEADVPYLAAAPELLQRLAPWLQARLRGQTLVSQVEMPDQLNYLEANQRQAR